MSANPDFDTSFGIASSGSDIQYSQPSGLRRIYPSSPIQFDQTSYYTNLFYILSRNVNNQLQEIRQLLNHPIAPDVELFLRQNNTVIPIIKTALERCINFLAIFFDSIRSDEDLELANISHVHANISHDYVQRNNIEVWEDPDFDDSPIPVLIISLPKRQEYNIFTLWEQIDQVIYKVIDPKLLYTSVREF